MRLQDSPRRAEAARHARMRVAVTNTGDWHVHCEHQRRGLRRLGAGQHVAHEAAIADHVELKPDRRAAGSARPPRPNRSTPSTSVNGMPALQAALAACTSPRRAHMPEIPTGPSTRGSSLARSEQGRAQVDARDIAQHALFEGDLLQVAHVPAERRLAVRAAIEIVEEKAWQPALRGTPEVIAGSKDHEVTGREHRHAAAPAAAVPASIPLGIGIDIQRTAAATSAALLIPGMTETTAGCASGNCNAAAASGTPCRVHTASIETTRAMMSAGARP